MQRRGDSAHVRDTGDHRPAQLGRRLDVARILPDLCSESVLRGGSLARYEVPIRIRRVECASVGNCPHPVRTLGDVVLQPELLLGVWAVALDQSDVARHVAYVAEHRIVERTLPILVHVRHPGITVLEVQHPAVTPTVCPGSRALEVSRAGLVQSPGGDRVLCGFEHRGQFGVVHQRPIRAHILLAVQQGQYLCRPCFGAGFHHPHGIVDL